MSAMTTLKDTASLAAGAIAQTSSPLFDLPTELFDQIMDHLFVYRSAIEFAPIELYRENMRESPLSACQYQHALDFQNHVRPGLRGLRVCKAIFAKGIHKYYSRNQFRFSSVFGWTVMARFFDLIGPNNIALLRDIAIVHPYQASGPSMHDDGVNDEEAFHLEHLSPFGMADLEDYEASYCVKNEQITPVNDPIQRLRGISDLRKLALLVYEQQYAGDGPAVTCSETVKHFAEKGMHEQHFQLLDWQPPSQASVTLVNLYCHRCSFSADNEPVLLRACEAEDIEEPEEAELVRAAARMHGWKLEDVMFCPSTGVWPLTEHDYEISDTKWLDNFCDDYEG